MSDDIRKIVNDTVKNALLVKDVVAKELAIEIAEMILRPLIDRLIELRALPGRPMVNIRSAGRRFRILVSANALIPLRFCRGPRSTSRRPRPS